jgi:hypothetical protein
MQRNCATQEPVTYLFLTLVWQCAARPKETSELRSTESVVENAEGERVSSSFLHPQGEENPLSRLLQDTDSAGTASRRSVSTAAEQQARGQKGAPCLDSPNEGAGGDPRNQPDLRTRVNMERGGKALGRQWDAHRATHANHGPYLSSDSPSLLGL